ncbi:MAG: molybdate ABC transporter substrate-binding protein [Acidobacteria bacterium]|nr:molybdate ABC transporter substrate-binding protein [Acidobacteriota bacterium]MBV9184588.1 molybdate ABC transporter substrate-binding protein [Acidobacteriota bacterium]
MTRRFFLLLCSFTLAVPVMAANLRVSAASSLTDALHEIGRIYHHDTGDTLLFDFGASSTLARQIAEGAPSDVFISADESKMDQLQQRGFIIKASRRSILSNTLVIIVPSDSNLKINGGADLADDAISNIAVAEPQSVPAGIYAKEYLRKLHVWDRIKDKLIPTENVRAALAAVESGNVQTGIVYRTDALISRSVRIAFEVPRAEGPRISYPAAIVGDSKQKAAAQRFIDFLQTPPAQDIFRKYGFIIK